MNAHEFSDIWIDWETVYHYHSFLLLQDSVTAKNIEIFTMNYVLYENL